MNNDADRLAKIEREANELRAKVRKKQRNCKHDWGDVVSDPIIEKKMVFSHYEGQGSDPWPVMVDGGTKSTPRWSRTCKSCKKKEYTKKTEVVKTRPKF